MHPQMWGTWQHIMRQAVVPLQQLLCSDDNGDPILLVARLE